MIRQKAGRPGDGADEKGDEEKDFRHGSLPEFGPGPSYHKMAQKSIKDVFLRTI
jgi:hypothetical protein